jgi:glycerol-3-phosphate O-acyltransferase
MSKSTLFGEFLRQYFKDDSLKLEELLKSLISNQKIQDEQNREKLIAQWKYNLEPIFDMNYLASKKNMLASLNDGVFTSGLEAVRNLSKDKDKRILFVSEHLSEQDYIELDKFFYRENIELPAIFAGANLLVPGLTKPSFLIRKPIVLDIKKSGTIVINRNLFKPEKEGGSAAYKRLFIETLLWYTDKDGNCEEGIFNKMNTFIFNSGRSYDGKARNYDFPTLDLFHRNSLRNPQLEHIIIPISISLERCIEDTSFEIQHLIKNSRLPWVEKLSGKYSWAQSINENWIKQTGKWGAMADILSFLIFSFTHQPRGEIYLDFGEPIYVRDFGKGKEDDLKNKITGSINSNIRITPASLVSLIARAHSEDYISHKDLVKKLNITRKELPKNLLSNYLSNDNTDKEVLERATTFLNEKRIFKAVPYFPVVKTYLIRKQSFILNYYANRIEHYKIQMPE